MNATGQFHRSVIDVAFCCVPQYLSLSSMLASAAGFADAPMHAALLLAGAAECDRGSRNDPAGG